MPKKKLTRGALPARVSRKRGQPRRSAKPRVLSWPARIKAARAAGRFSIADRYDAGNWPTCACGELDAAIPRRGDRWDNFAPVDGALFSLGRDFFAHVESGKFGLAGSTIRAITKRAAEVLREQRSK